MYTHDSTHFKKLTVLKHVGVAPALDFILDHTSDDWAGATHNIPQRRAALGLRIVHSSTSYGLH
jgi:hypothetical protein